MSYDVISAEYVGEYKLKVTFENQRQGIVDFLSLIRKGGVFAKLEDMECFKRFDVNAELGVLTWGGEVDIAPETLYSRATGEPLPEWMESKEMLTGTA